MHFRKRKAIIKSWHQGFKLRALAHYYRVSQDEARQVLIESGVQKKRVSCREENRND